MDRNIELQVNKIIVHNKIHEYLKSLPPQQHQHPTAQTSNHTPAETYKTEQQHPATEQPAAEE
jgi:hypothetical protein